MKEISSTLTTKGQVTIPVEVRRLLGLAPYNKVSFVIEDGEVRLTKGGSVVKRTAGIFKSHRAPLSAEELREEAERAIAQEVIERMGG